MGAYLSTAAPGVPTWLFALIVPGCYTFQNYACDVYGYFTNTTPTDAYRGAGRPEAAFLMERMVDLLARELRHGPGRRAAQELHPCRRLPLHQRWHADLRQRQLSGVTRPRRWRWWTTSAFRQRAAADCVSRGAISASASLPMWRSAAWRHRLRRGDGLPGRPVGTGDGACAGDGEGGRANRHQSARPGRGDNLRPACRRACWACPVEDVDVVHGDTGRNPDGLGHLWQPLDRGRRHGDLQGDA